MKHSLTQLIALPLLCLSLSAPASATSLNDFNGLRNDPTLSAGLRAVAIADAIRKECDRLSPRYLRAYAFMRALYDHAKSLGYSDAVIEAYVEDDTEKARVRGEAMVYLRSQGD